MSSVTLTLFLLLSLTIDTFAQSVKPEDRCTVEGTVTNAKTGEPLNKARVMMSRMGEPGEPMAVVTDATGRFKLADVDPGRYSIFVFRIGFVRQQSGGPGPGQAASTITLVTRQNLRNVDFKMLPAAVVTGRVVDEDGESVARARIQALRWRYSQGRRELMPSGGATTDDQGRYRMFDLSPGRYYFSATYDDPRLLTGSAERSSADNAQGDQGYAPLYYPGATDPAQAASTRLQPGEERTGLDFILTPTRTVRIRGKVLNAAGGSGGQESFVMVFPVQASGAGFYSRSSSRVGRDGSFQIRGLTAGSHVLSAYGPSAAGGEERLSARKRVEVGTSNVEGVELVLQPGLELKGLVHVEGESDPQFSVGGLSVYLRPLDMTPMMGGGSGSVRPDGTFTMKNVAEGEYRIMVARLPQNGYLKAAKLGDADVLGKGLVVTEGSAVSALQLVISTAGGAIEGTVLDDKKTAATGATVVLVPESERRAQSDLYKMATADQNGRFTLQGIPPGDYKLFAWDRVEPGAYQDPEFLKPFESKGKEITVREKDRQVVELKMLQAEEPSQ